MPPLEFRPYENNRNLGSLRGKYMIEESFEQTGAGRGAVSDRNGVILAGTSAFEVAKEKGLKIRAVKSCGKKLIAVKRRDLQLDRDEQARLLAYADNRAGEVNRTWDKIGLLSDHQKGIKMAEFMPPERLLDMAKSVTSEWDKERSHSDTATKKIRISLPQEEIDRYYRLVKGKTPELQVANLLALVS